MHGAEHVACILQATFLLRFWIPQIPGLIFPSKDLMADQLRDQPVGTGPPGATERFQSHSSAAQSRPQESTETLVYESVIGPNHQFEAGPDVHTPNQTQRTVGFPDMDSPRTCSSGSKLCAPGAPGPSFRFPFISTPLLEPNTVRSPGTAHSIRGKCRRPPAPPAAKLAF